MKNYEYQILRYIPDRVNAEFVNVGIVFYSKDNNYLKSAFINRSKRLSSFFHGLNVQHILQTLRYLKKELDTKANQIETEFGLSKIDTVDRITNEMFAKDDTALVFSEVFKGIDNSLEDAFKSIENQLIYKYDYNKNDKLSLSDEDVWNTFYRKYFKNIGIEILLKEHHVKTNIDSLKFTKAWQNGIWHCYEPVYFNLKREEDVRNKILHWSGIINWLESADEPVKVDLLSVMPSNNTQKDLIRKALKNKTVGKSSFSIVEETEIEQFANQLIIDFEEHVTNTT